MTRHGRKVFLDSPTGARSENPIGKTESQVAFAHGFGRTAFTVFSRCIRREASSRAKLPRNADAS